jgi:tetratricopeptide (TPR) repeat protein
MTKAESRPEANIFSGRDTTRDFLFTPPAATTEDADPPLDDAAARDALQQAFPDVLWADEFLENTTVQMRPLTCFGTMIIRRDAAAGSGKTNRDDACRHILEIGRTVDELCKRENGAWGPLDTDSLACFFPGKNDTDALHLARDIQESVQEVNSGSVSIGIASYPTKDYKKSDVFENARKALTHASFFGAGSRVLFDAVSLNISGDEHYQKGDVPGAIAELKQALSLDPQNVNVLNSLGVCYGVAGELEHALEAFRQAIQHDPKEVMAVYNAGYVSGLLTQTADAIAYYQQAEAIDKDVFEVAFQLGKLYLDQGKASEAKEYLKKAVRLQPESWIASFHMGACCEALNMIDEAVSHYEAAVKKNPTDACALSALGILYDEKAENPEISALFCEKAVEMSPENGLYQFRLGKVYTRQEQPDKALSAFSRAVKLGYPADAELAMTQANLQHKDGDG